MMPDPLESLWHQRPLAEYRVLFGCGGQGLSSTNKAAFSLSLRRGSLEIVMSMNQLKPFADKVEDVADRLGTPLKPYLPLLARFLLVVTFFEDSLRITTQWDDQIWYLEKHRKMPWGMSHTFLFVNVVRGRKPYS